MSVDFNQHFIDFLFDALNEYRAKLPSQKMSAKMWKEEGFRCWDAWHAAHKKTRKKRVVTSPEAERIYALYPRKTARIDALRAIVDALRRLPADEMERRVTAYAAAVATWPADERKFIPHAATWFNAGRYDDDPSAWNKGAPAKLNGHAPEITEPVGWKMRLLQDFPDCRQVSDGCLNLAWDQLTRSDQKTITEALRSNPKQGYRQVLTDS